MYVILNSISYLSLILILFIIYFSFHIVYNRVIKSLLQNCKKLKIRNLKNKLFLDLWFHVI